MSQTRNNEHRGTKGKSPRRRSAAGDHVADVQGDAEDGDDGSDLHYCPKRPIEANQRLFIAELQCHEDEALHDGDGEANKTRDQGDPEASSDEFLALRVGLVHAFGALHDSAESPRCSEEKAKNGEEEEPEHGFGLRPFELVHEAPILETCSANSFIHSHLLCWDDEDVDNPGRLVGRFLFQVSGGFVGSGSPSLSKLSARSQLASKNALANLRR